MKRRVVISGMGVVAPNGSNLDSFTQSIREGKSGIRKIPELEEKGFRCQVGGVPRLEQEQIEYLASLGLDEHSAYLSYALLAGKDAWLDGGLPVPDPESGESDPQSGIILGTGFAGIDLTGNRLVPAVDSGQLRKIRSDLVEQVMLNAPAALLTRILALGNISFCNSNACATGTDAIIMAYEYVTSGKAARILAGGADGASPYYWALFDSMRILAPNHNHEPERASRPMSATACGFVPAAGAAMLMIEDAETALKRGAKIYAEILGGSMNTGGQRQGGSMTAANPHGIESCIRAAMKASGVKPGDIDLISGHLTATKADASEVALWMKSLDLDRKSFPYIQSLKSMTGHLLGASGAIETLAAALQMSGGFIHPSINCEDLHPSVAEIIPRESIPATCLSYSPRHMIKASFGFGDVNACLVLGQFKA